MSKGINRISSQELSNLTGFTASQIRQDLNNFGGFGQQGYGYNVEYLYNEIGKILGLENKYNVIIIGAGNLGQALANYQDFGIRGFVVQALFDVNPSLAGVSIRGKEVHLMDELETYMKEHEVHIAALTVPKTSAPKVASDLVKWGIKGIWNFAPTDLNLPENIMIENVHLEESLMRLSYKIKSQEDFTKGQ